METTAPRCHRCGEPLRPAQLTCAVCGTGIGIPAMPDDGDRSDEPGHSSMFLMPPEVFNPTIVGRSTDRDNNRLLISIALGLAAVSLVGGILYYLYYLRVGNRVTALLPRDTVAYVRVRWPGRLVDAFETLALWQTTRPVRDRMRGHEQQLTQALLLDIGINRGVLEQLKHSVREGHVALVATEQQPGALLPWDVLVFLELDSEPALEQLSSELKPFFAPAGEENGVEYGIRRVGTTAVSMATIDGILVLCLGSDTTMRDVLRAQERGPNRSLNDAPGFRMAFRGQAHDETDIWAYIRHDHLVDAAIQNLLAPLLDEKQRLALVPYIMGLRDADVEGAGVAINLRGGVDAGRFGFYPGTTDAFADLEDQTGAHPKTTLSAIPPDAVLTVAGSLEDPLTLFAEWRGPVLGMLKALGFFGPEDNPDQGVNRLQAESGVYLTADVWPNLAREIAVAYLPVEGQTELSWLLVLRVHDAERALDVVSRIARHIFDDDEGSFDGTHRFAYADGLHRITFTAPPPPPGTYVEAEGSDEPEETEVLCWSDVGSLLVISPSCDGVRASRKAERLGTGLDADSDAAAALAHLPDETTLVFVARLRPVLERLTGRLSVLDLVSEDFVAAASIGVHADRLELSANVSALSLGFLWATGLLDAEPTPQPDPCRELVQQVCGHVSDADCTEWIAKIAGSTTQACRTGLRTMKTLEQPSAPEG